MDKNLKLGIIELMKSCNLWNESLCNEIPINWQKYDNFVLFSDNFFKNEIWQSAGERLWQLICQLLKVQNVAVKGRIKNDDYRTPIAKIVYGNTTTVFYTDNKIKYSWNIESNMFCAGNAPERHRIAKLNCSDEVIVDLFAGIGYFTLPYLVHANAKFVHACEWNPFAVEALRRNLELNKASDKCKIYQGDNRKVCPKRVGNRINLGLLPSTKNYWRTACEALLNDGGILYVHENINCKSNRINCEICEQLMNNSLLKGDKLNISKYEFITKSNLKDFKELNELILWKKFEWFLFSIHLTHNLFDIFNEIYDNSWKITVNNVYKVKSYAPHIYHIVFEVLCFPVN